MVVPSVRLLCFRKMPERDQSGSRLDRPGFVMDHRRALIPVLGQEQRLRPYRLDRIPSSTRLRPLFSCVPHQPEPRPVEWRCADATVFSFLFLGSVEPGDAVLRPRGHRSRLGEVGDKGVDVDIAPDPVGAFLKDAEPAAAARQVAVDGDPVPAVGLDH